MFALPGTINFLCNSTAIILCRNYVRRARPAINAGLRNQLQILNEPENIDIEDNALDFDDYESDFSTIGHSYTDFQNDMQKHKEMEKRFIVKRKYFKETNYNFLTWSEKEQLKHLHQSDPIQYSVERLAEIFPASDEVVSKILKSNWKIKNPDRILKHDKMVELNWSLLRKGQIQIEQEYKDHLLKFSSREKLVLNEEKYFPKQQFQQVNHTFTPSSTEFSSIIESYNKKKNNGDSQNPTNTNIKNQDLVRAQKPLKDTYVMDSDTKEITSKPMTFSNFKQEMNFQNNNYNEKQSSKVVVKAKNTMNVLEERPIQIFGDSFHKNDALKPIDADIQIANFIKIPKKLWKKGQTYKINDCFYDDDGRFLYRVPGLMANKN